MTTEFKIGDIHVNESNDEEISLMIRCQEWTISNADTSEISPADAEMWLRIEKVLNDNVDFILNSCLPKDDDEDLD